MNKIHKENRMEHADKLKKTVLDLLSRNQEGYAVLVTFMAMGCSQDEAAEYVVKTAKGEEYEWTL